MGFRRFGEPLARRFAGVFGSAAVQPVTYFIRDDFTTALAAGAVNGTASEPGPGARHVTDFTGSKVSIANNKIRLVGDGSFNHEGFWLTPALTRLPGLVVRTDFAVISGTGQGFCSITTAQDANFAGYNNVGINFFNSGSHIARRATGGTSCQITASGETAGSFYQILRNAGRYILFDPGAGSGDVKLLWWDDWDTTATLYIGVMAVENNFTSDWDNIHCPQQYFNIGVYALASDSFNRTDGALGSTDGAGHVEANGGSGKAWAETAGTWAIATNKAAASALSGGLAFATIDVLTKDVVLSVKMTRSAGVCGLVLRYVDASNYVIVYHDGTNVKMDEVVAGTPTTRISAAATYAAGAALRIRISNNTPATNRAMVYYNDLFVGSYGTNASALTGTKVGLYTTDTGNTFDNFIAFGAFGYNTLRQY